MANVNAKPRYEAQLKKTSFDVSQTFNFTSSCGHILPVWYDIANPGERFDLSCNLFTRTQPLVNAPMVDIDEYVDYFFVPFTLIHGHFDSWIYGIKDFHSTLMDYQFSDTDFTSSKLPLVASNNIRWDLLVNTTAKTTSVTAMQYSFTSNGEPQFEEYIRNAARLCDMLNVSSYDFFTFKRASSTLDYNVPVYPFAAYQAICDRYYRLSDWVTAHVESYNFDDLLKSSSYILSDNDTASPYITDKVRFADLMRLHYRPLHLDYFTNTQPSPLQNATNLLSQTEQSASLLAVNDYINGISFEYGTSANSDASIYPSPTYSKTYLGSSVGSVQPWPVEHNIASRFAPTINQIRVSSAVEKLLAVTQRAGKHYDDQTLAHFGVKVDKDKYHDVLCIGSHKQQIHIGEVTATATTGQGETGVLGAIGGKGYGSGDSRKITFTAPCHGIVMACYSCVPRIKRCVKYDKLGLKFSRTDFYQPEFDNLGMQPLFGYECLAADTPYTAANVSSIAGWQYRYMEDKVKYDRTTPAFLSDGQFKAWTITYDGLTDGTNYAKTLFCSPHMLDQIMVKSYDSNNISFTYTESEYSALTPQEAVKDLWSSLYASDPLIHNLKINAYKYSPMSAYGLPRLD